MGREGLSATAHHARLRRLATHVATQYSVWRPCHGYEHVAHRRNTHGKKKRPSVTWMLRIVSVDGKQRYHQALFNKNVQIRAHFALVGGKMEHHPGGRYSLRYRTPEGNRVWQAVGNDPDQALTSKIQREHILQGAKLGNSPYPGVLTDRSLISPSEAPEVALANRKRIDASVNDRINEVSIRKLWKTGPTSILNPA